MILVLKFYFHFKLARPSGFDKGDLDTRYRSGKTRGTPFIQSQNRGRSGLLKKYRKFLRQTFESQSDQETSRQHLRHHPVPLQKQFHLRQQISHRMESPLSMPQMPERRTSDRLRRKPKWLDDYLFENKYWALSIRPKIWFEISKISGGKWNNKSGNFPVGYASPVGPNRSIQFQKEISRNLRRRGTANRNIFEWNSNLRSEWSNRKKRSTLKGGPSSLVGQNRSIHFRTEISKKLWLNGKCPIIYSSVSTGKKYKMA